MRTSIFKNGVFAICFGIALYKLNFMLTFFRKLYEEKESNLTMNSVQNILTKKKLIFAFSSDLDIHVDAVDLLSSLNCNAHIPDSFFTSLTDDQQICETVLYFFTRGFGSEIFVSSRNEFNKMVGIVQSLKRSEDLGGNAASMALRAFKECASVYLHSMMTTKYYKQLFNSSISIVPPQFLQETMHDIHIVIDFSEGECYKGINAPRTNRLYLQSDQDNTQFPGLEHIVQEIKLARPHVFAIGGFQLMNHKHQNEISLIMDSLASKLVEIKQFEPNLKIHLEMGAFTDEFLMEQIVNKLFKLVHSSGMNEDEVEIVVNFLKHKNLNEESLKKSTNDVIEKAVELIGLLEEMDSSIERIHFHTASIQMICQQQEWRNSKQALARSILVGLAQAMKDENDNGIDNNFEEFSNLMVIIQLYDCQSFQMSVIELAKLYGERETLRLHDKQQMTIDEIIRCWMISDDWECCLAPTIIHASPKRTSGLGDNIAATSLLYQIQQ